MSAVDQSISRLERIASGKTAAAYYKRSRQAPQDPWIGDRWNAGDMVWVYTENGWMPEKYARLQEDVLG